MNTPQQLDQSAKTREAVGLVLLVVGTIGLFGVCFAVHPLLGGALASLATIAGGLYLAAGKE